MGAELRRAALEAVDTMTASERFCRGVSSMCDETASSADGDDLAVQLGAAAEVLGIVADRCARASELIMDALKHDGAAASEGGAL